MCRPAVLAAAAALILALQFAAPPEAGAIDGRERRHGASPLDDEPFKGATAKCSSKSKRVVGGGAAINDGGRNLPRLVTLLPQSYDGQLLDSFSATAEAPNLSRSYDWSVSAYAICADADQLHRYQIVPDFVDVPADGGPFASTAARCPGGTVAYSAGRRDHRLRAQLRSAWPPARSACSSTARRAHRTSPGPPAVNAPAARAFRGG